MEERVYFATGGGMTRVGRAHDVPDRLRRLRQDCPCPLTIVYTHVGGQRLERAVHRHLRGRGLLDHDAWFTGEFTTEEAAAAVAEATRLFRTPALRPATPAPVRRIPSPQRVYTEAELSPWHLQRVREQHPGTTHTAWRFEAGRAIPVTEGGH